MQDDNAMMLGGPRPTIAVCIGTFGDPEWEQKAKRLVDEVWRTQSDRPNEVFQVHSDTLAKARNTAASCCASDWLCFLDADDSLDSGYIAAMRGSVVGSRLLSTHQTFLHQPATLGVYPDGREDAEPVLIPQRPLDTGNFMVIGTLVERSLFEEVGGFSEWHAYEDWELWIRCHKAGAGFLQVPGAVYRVSVNENGRNSLKRDEAVALFNKIRKLHYR